MKKERDFCPVLSSHSSVQIEADLYCVALIAPQISREDFPMGFALIPQKLLYLLPCIAMAFHVAQPVFPAQDRRNLPGGMRLQSSMLSNRL